MVSPDGRKLLRIEARNTEVPIERKPEWIRTRLKTGPEFTAIASLVQAEGLHTVCQEAGCPNIYECWEDREATFLIGGEQCTRRCDFCQIDTGKPAPLDRGEPLRVAESVRTMGLRYATVTGVARDDLPDEGAWLYAETVRQIHELNPGTGVEVLIPDFSANPALLAQVFEAAPEVLAHNLETVPRLFRRIRPAFTYERSLDVITQARTAGLVTKSNLILGMGEEIEEVHQALRDLLDAGCELITITQYLRPTPRHHPVERWVRPEEFVALAEVATDMGFAGVMSGPARALQLPGRSPVRPGPGRALGRPRMTARVVALHVWPEGEAAPTPVDALTLDWGGPLGDRHHGETMLSNTRQKPVFERGTRIRNHRQVSIVDADELSRIADALGIATLEPGLIADNICTEGIPDLTALPRMTRLVFEGGAVLMTGGENLPCTIAGALVEAVHGTRPEAFPKAAMGLRGITGWVEHPGVVHPGASIRIVTP